MLTSTTLSIKKSCDGRQGVHFSGTAPQNRVSYRSGGDSTPPHNKRPPNRFSSCARSNPRCAPLSSVTSTGSLLTPLLPLTPNLASLPCISTATKSLRSVTTTMTIFDGGWQSNTTKSRLNALCSEFCIAGEGVFQKNFQWFVRKFVGQSPVTGKVFNVEDFSNGYVFA